MNITFLIGNGFDINLGLNTKYTDFLDSYLKKEVENKLIIDFKKEIASKKDKWSYAEKEFGNYTGNFDGINKTAEDFCECHEHFCLHLSEFLIKQEERLYYDSVGKIMAEKFAEAIRNITFGFREDEENLIKNSISHIGEGENYNFIVFNYTRTVDVCVEEIIKTPIQFLGQRIFNRNRYNNDIGKTIHVHGYVDDDMVLGVNDESQIINTKLFDNFPNQYKYQIIKKETNILNGRSTDKKALDVLNASDFIYIYGMSIGDTDNLWWDRIVKLMKSKQRLHIVIHTYTEKTFPVIRTKYITFVNKEIDGFLTHSEFYATLNDDEKKHIRNRVHICTDNIFADMNNLVNDKMNFKGAAFLSGLMNA